MHIETNGKIEDKLITDSIFFIRKTPYCEDGEPNWSSRSWHSPEKLIIRENIYINELGVDVAAVPFRGEDINVALVEFANTNEDSILESQLFIIGCGGNYNSKNFNIYRPILLQSKDLGDINIPRIELSESDFSRVLERTTNKTGENAMSLLNGYYKGEYPIKTLDRNLIKHEVEKRVWYQEQVVRGILSNQNLPVKEKRNQLKDVFSESKQVILENPDLMHIFVSQAYRLGHLGVITELKQMFESVRNEITIEAENDILLEMIRGELKMDEQSTKFKIGLRRIASQILKMKLKLNSLR